MELSNDSEVQTRAAARPLVRIMAVMLLALAGPAGAQTSVRLELLGTTDVHTYVWPYDYYTGKEVGYGLTRLAPVVDSVRQANPGNTYLFDSGDLLQGNPFGFVAARLHPAQPNPIIRAMNLLRYDAAAVGNHEYNYGLANLNQAMREAAFPFLSANVFHHNTNEHAYKPYVLIPHVVAPGDTILIGVTANTPPGVAIWDRGNVEGVLDFRDIVSSLKPVVAELKQRGADVVVLLSHGGLQGTSYDTAATGVPVENASAEVARQVPGIDVIFMGHTHVEVRDTTINGVLLTQAKNWAQSLSDVTLELARRSANDWVVSRKRARILKPDRARADTALLDSLRLPHEQTVAYVNSVAGRSSARMDALQARREDTPIIDFINEVQRRAAGTQLSAAAAFDTTAVIPKGPVTIADIAGLYIYDNTLKAVRITGAQLRAYLEKSAEYFDAGRHIPGYNFDIVSGVDYTIDVGKPAGRRITRLYYRGKPVTDTQTFTMAVNNYRQGGGGGFSMIAHAPVIYDRQQSITDLLINELRTRKLIRPQDYFVQNWRIVRDH